MGNEKAIRGELPTMPMELHNPKGYPKCFVSPELQASRQHEKLRGLHLGHKASKHTARTSGREKIAHQTRLGQISLDP